MPHSPIMGSELPARATILQGADMGRPSRLLVDLTVGSDRVQVTGTAAPIPAGEA